MKRSRIAKRVKDLNIVQVKVFLLHTNVESYLAFIYFLSSKRNIVQQISERIIVLVEHICRYTQDFDNVALYFDYSNEPKNLKELPIYVEFKYFHPKYYNLIASLISNYFNIHISIPGFESFKLQKKKYTFLTYNTTYLNKTEDLSDQIIFLDDPNINYYLEHFKNCSRFTLDIETFGNSTNVLTKSNKAQALKFREGYIRLIQVGIEVADQRYAIIFDLGGWQRNIYDFSKPTITINTEGIKEYSPKLELDNLVPIEKEFLDILQQQLFATDVAVLGTNLKFDLTYILHHFGFRANNTVDIMLASQIYWSGVGVDKALPGTDRGERSRINHGLLGIAERLGFEVNKDEQNTDWGFVLSNSQLNYAAEDVFIVFDIWDKLKALIMEDHLAFSVKAEFKALPVFVEMEVYGTPVNVPHARELLTKYIEAQEKVLVDWNKAFPDTPFTERDNVLKGMVDQYGLDIDAVNKKELKVLEGKYPWVRSLLQARTLGISISYIEDILDKTFVNAKGIPSVASTFFQIREGWRSSSRNPNLQNSPKLPKEFLKYNLEPVRTIFAPDPLLYDLVIKDASGCHARIATEASQDEVLKAAYNANKDNHLITAIAILASTGEYYTYDQILEIHSRAKKKKALGEELTEEESFILEARDRAKTGFYSFLNQAGKVTMQKNFKQYGFEVPLEDCAKLKGALIKTYNTLYSFIMEQVSIANSYDIQFDFYDKQGNSIAHERYGMIRGLCGGRKFCKKEPNKWNDDKMEVPFTDSISFMWLSAEASMLLLTLGTLREWLLSNNHWSYICNFQHDELDVVTTKEESLTVATKAKDILVGVLSLFIETIPVDDVKETPEKSICSSLADK